MRMACSRGQLASRAGSGGAVHGRGALWPAASCRGRPDGGAVGLQGWPCDEGGVGCVDWERGRAKTSAGHRQWDVATRCARVQNMRSGRAQSTHAACSAECHGMPEGSKSPTV